MEADSLPSYRQDRGKKRVLFICSRNTCRSPIAKVILEYILAERGYVDRIVVDYAALCIPALQNTEPRAVEAIKSLFGKNLLASHRSKSITT